MIFIEYMLSGTCRAAFETEVRYNIASARVAGAELVRLTLTPTGDEKEDKRILTCLIKVLRAMKREGVIQFYADPVCFAVGATEASFLYNKYEEHILPSDESSIRLYVKL